MKNPFRGLRIGGRITHHHVAHSVDVSILSMHRPEKLVWSWFVDFYRYRPESGCKHRFFRIQRHGSDWQPRVSLDLFWLGSLNFCWQPMASDPRYQRAA